MSLTLSRIFSSINLANEKKSVVSSFNSLLVSVECILGQIPVECNEWHTWIGDNAAKNMNSLKYIHLEESKELPS